jgi:hypothetical protein
MMMGNKRRAAAASGGDAHFLPEEIMTEVFLRLPVKAILRLRAVCRSWNAELSSDEFCRLHMTKAEAESAPLNLFFTSPTAGFDATAVYSSSSSGPDDDLLFTLDDVRGGDFIHVTPGPCRGLTLLHDPFAPAYYIFNASTRAVTQLPPCHRAAYVTTGLGFDARTKKYKVVRLFRGDRGDKQHIKCEIYTLGSDHGDDWKPPAAGVPFRFCRAARATISHARHDKLLPVFGFLHWLLNPSFVVKDDIMHALNALFFGDSRMFRSLSNAFIVLLPKKPDVSTPGDYRPITMIHSFGKLASKLPAARLAPRLSQIISPNQNAFIRTRTIHDNFKFVQRAVVYIQKNKIPKALLKLDISKAFDTVAWPFLLNTLQAFGFGDLWRRWVATLLSTATSCIMLNGIPGKCIRHARGVRQGDLLSPMLFVIVMEVFARLFVTPTEQGIVRPMGTLVVRHHCSLYTDDVMLFMHPDAREARAVRELLRVFEEASGLHTNLAKCSITPIYGSDEPAATTTDPWVPDVRIPDHLPRPTSEHQEDTQGEDPSNN